MASPRSKASQRVHYVVGTQLFKDHLPYSPLPNKDLKRHCATRGIERAGSKGEMIRRLRAYVEKHPFQFLSLPGEVRNAMYDLLISDEQHGEYNPYGLDPERFSENTTLLQTCQKVRQEGLTLLLSSRKINFVVQNPDPRCKFTRWISTIQPSHRWALSELQLRMSHDDWSIQYSAELFAKNIWDVTALLSPTTKLTFELEDLGREAWRRACRELCPKLLFATAERRPSLVYVGKGNYVPDPGVSWSE